LYAQFSQNLQIVSDDHPLGIVLDPRQQFLFMASNELVKTLVDVSNGCGVLFQVNHPIPSAEI
jgi:hypothetical protein